MNNEIEDFIHRCKILSILLDNLKSIENSDRVWVAVLTTTIIEIVENQKDPRGCMNQVMETLDLALIEVEKQESLEEETPKD